MQTAKCKIKKLKGQAAIEYLMNYSWAILILAIVFALLFAGGMFNPNYFLMQECYLGPSFSCQSKMTEAGPNTQIDFKVTNILGYKIKVSSISLYSRDVGSLTVNPNVELDNSNSYQYAFVVNKALPKGSVERMNLNITYYICAEEVNPICNPDAEFSRFASGRITSSVDQ
ncbi:hypothetical protein KJ780_00515 [Candidatus Micrarchaeota archaeon]|nr:hypothetical protein [Candidatus Micrarchaeota archaeon]